MGPAACCRVEFYRCVTMLLRFAIILTLMTNIKGSDQEKDVVLAQVGRSAVHDLRRSWYQMRWLVLSAVGLVALICAVPIRVAGWRNWS
jgi:hypothetical protein